MPPAYFKCPDGQSVGIKECLHINGCRLQDRCAPLPYLRLVGSERPYKGVTASMSGNGPRYIYLREVMPYTIDPAESAFAFMGTMNHLRAAENDQDVISEEKLEVGTLDLLSQDESNPGFFIVEDYKTYGSYRAAKVLGLVQYEEPVMDDSGKPVLLKTGKNKGKPKAEKKFRTDPATADIYGEQLQLSRYTIDVENKGLPVSRLKLFIVPRDGGTFTAKGRGITEKIYYIEIPRLSNEEVAAYYSDLQDEVDKAFETGHARICTPWESWDYRRCQGYCPVSEACKELSNTGGN